MILPQIIHEEPCRGAMELKGKVGGGVGWGVGWGGVGRGKHQGVDHSLSGVRAGR